MADTNIKKDIKKEGTGAEMPIVGDVAPENPLYGRLRTIHPDREFADDMERNGALDSYMSELEGYKKSGTEANSKLVSILESDPELAAVLKDMVAGSSFRGAIARHMDLSSMTPEEGEPDFEEWTNNLNERKTKKDEESAFMKSLEENNDFSKAEFKA